MMTTGMSFYFAGEKTESDFGMMLTADVGVVLAFSVDVDVDVDVGGWK